MVSREVLTTNHLPRNRDLKLPNILPDVERTLYDFINDKYNEDHRDVPLNIEIPVKKIAGVIEGIRVAVMAGEGSFDVYKVEGKNSYSLSYVVPDGKDYKTIYEKKGISYEQMENALAEAWKKVEARLGTVRGNVPPSDSSSLLGAKNNLV